jgi:hypothetical protein
MGLSTSKPVAIKSQSGKSGMGSETHPMTPVTGSVQKECRRTSPLLRVVKKGSQISSGGFQMAESYYQSKDIRFYFKEPYEIPLHVLEAIHSLIVRGGGVGPSHINDNLRNAYLVSYAMSPEDRVVGTVTLKRPLESYRKKIEEATGLDLSGYLERGYTSVDPQFRDRDIADTLIKGLIDRSKGEKIYVTISMHNKPALELTYKNGMILAATYTNPRTGNELGVFVNQKL